MNLTFRFFSGSTLSLSLSLFLSHCWCLLPQRRITSNIQPHLPWPSLLRAKHPPDQKLPKGKTRKNLTLFLRRSLYSQPKTMHYYKGNPSIFNDPCFEWTWNLAVHFSSWIPNYTLYDFGSSNDQRETVPVIRVIEGKPAWMDSVQHVGSTGGVCPEF